MTIFLKFTDEAEAVAALASFRTVDNQWIFHKDGVDIDIIGIIHKPSGAMLMSSDGFMYPEMQPLDGFHVNLVGELSENLQSFVIYPKTPSRVFANG